MKIVKKGLFGAKNIAPKYIYKKTEDSKNSYRTVINEFTSCIEIKKLLFQFIDSLKYNISIKVFKNQLSLLSPLTLDDKLKILNMTLQYKWKSLVPAYEVLEKSKRVRFDNVKSSFLSKEEISKIMDLSGESF